MHCLSPCHLIPVRVFREQVGTWEVFQLVVAKAFASFGGWTKLLWVWSGSWAHPSQVDLKLALLCTFTSWICGRPCLSDHIELSIGIYSSISRRFCHWISCFTEQREVPFARVSDDFGNCLWEQNMPVRDCDGHGVEILNVQLCCKMKEAGTSSSPWGHRQRMAYAHMA